MVKHSMARKDRLYQMIEILKNGRLTRAQDMADRLGVTVRTIYRDMDTLIASGVPIEGTRGLGYRAVASVTLPPLNLTMTELEALHVGMAVVGDAGDDELREAAQSLSAKIDAVLPEDRSTAPAGWGLAVYPFADVARGFEHMPVIRNAIRARQKLRVTTSQGTRREAQTVRPLALDYWGRIWSAIVWSETAQDFLTLRVDQITAMDILPQLFVEEDSKTLADFRARD